MTILDISSIANPVWQMDALCKQFDPSTFLGDDEAVESQDRRFKPWDAIKICKQCPVREACLDYALEAQKEFRLYGIWGGVTERQRQQKMKRCKYPGCKTTIKTRDNYCSEDHHKKHIKRLRAERERPHKTDFYANGTVRKYNA